MWDGDGGGGNVVTGTARSLWKWANPICSY